MRNNIPQYKNNNLANNFIPNINPIMNNYKEMMEPIDNQDMTTEILNISKIKEGFYIGDHISAISLDVIIQFKITHMINATGNQITNQWGAIGISYLTLNWTETPNQILFDPKDEIANRIVEFIDNSYIIGEGVLAHSFRGQDRVCIVVIIYLMKKYKWSLKKSMEYLRSKKQDVDIPEYFLEQLQKFENRMKFRNELTIDIPWEFEGITDPEEKLMRNTYLNGFKPEIPNENKNKNNLKHIIWADINSFQKCPIEITDTENDLFFKKNIKPVFNHIKIKPKKGCIKGNNYNKKEDNNLNKMNELNNIKNNINAKKNFIMNRNEFKNNNNYENEKNEKISYNNFIEQKTNLNKWNDEQRLNEYLINKNFNNIANNQKILNHNNNFIQNENFDNINKNNIEKENINFGHITKFNQQQEILKQANKNEKKDKSPLRNFLNQKRDNINNNQNIMNDHIRTNNSVNIQKSSQTNNQNNINNSNKINNITNYFKMNTNQNSSVFSNIPFSTSNSMNINNNNIIINEISKSQNQRMPLNINNNINSIKTNDFGNLSNSNSFIPQRQNKFINIPEQNNNMRKIRNKNDYSPFLKENKKNKNENINYNNYIHLEKNINNSAGFMNMNNNVQNILNNNSSNNGNIMSSTLNNFNNPNNTNNYLNYNHFKNEKKFKINDYSNNNLNNNNDFINYTPLMEERHNQSNKFNKPLNNFNPNLIKRRGTPQIGGHISLLNRNQVGGPIKIKNNNHNNKYNNNMNCNHIKQRKPTTPDLNLNHKQKNINNNFININNIHSNNNKNKYNVNHNQSNNYNNFNSRASNTMPNGFGYSGPNNYNKKGIIRPSTAPHKDKNIKNNNKINNNMPKPQLRHNQRPSSAGGKNKNMNNERVGLGIGKNMSNANLNKNRKKKLGLEMNKRLSTPQINSNNNMGYNNNINNNGISNKFNQSKNRMPSPMIKSNNYKRPPLPNNKNRLYNNKNLN